MVEFTNVNGKPLYIRNADVRAVDSVKESADRAAVYVDGLPTHFIVKGSPAEVASRIVRPALVPETT